MKALKRQAETSKKKPSLWVGVKCGSTTPPLHTGEDERAEEEGVKMDSQAETLHLFSNWLNKNELLLVCIFHVSGTGLLEVTVFRISIPSPTFQPRKGEPVAVIGPKPEEKC